MSPRVRKILSVGALALAGLFVLSEIGLVDVNVHTRQSASTYQSEHWDDARFPKVGVRTVSVEFGADSAAAAPEVVQVSDPGLRTDIRVRVAPYAVEGLTWMPLYKTGSCTYSAKVERDGQEWGTLDGTIELTVKGLASARFVHQNLRQEIREQAQKTVDSWFKHIEAQERASSVR